jgi:ATP-dependent RNA helicase SUPV3L1/SUV3
LGVVGQIDEIGDVTGDEVEIKRYTRLGKLEVGSPIISLSSLKKGDCVVTFSRRDIYKLRDMIQDRTRFKVCVVYGSLPPKTRQQQAKTFNDPNSGYDILVASDAIGMGLNLNIGRVIFSSLKVGVLLAITGASLSFAAFIMPFQKFDGIRDRFLTVSEVLQIAGRAGRAFSAYDSGIVTCLSTETYRNNISYLVGCLGKTPPVLEQMGLYPTYENLEAFAQRRPHCSFAELLSLFRKYASLDGMFFMSSAIDDHVKIASSLEQ